MQSLLKWMSIIKVGIVIIKILYNYDNKLLNTLVKNTTTLN